MSKAHHQIECLTQERDELQAKFHNKDVLARELTDQLAAAGGDDDGDAEGTSLPQDDHPTTPAKTGGSPGRGGWHALPSPIMAAEISNLQKALDKAERGKAELKMKVDEVCRERDELLELCDILREEMIVAVNGGEVGGIDRFVGRKDVGRRKTSSQQQRQHAPESSHEEEEEEEASSDNSSSDTSPSRRKRREELQRMEREVEKYR